MKINTVKSARKDQGTCESCRQPIKAGSGYMFIEPRYGGKRKRHLTCPTWRPSEMTSSKMGEVYAAQEGAEDSIGSAESLEDIAQALETAADEAEGVAEEYRDGISNMPDGLQESPVAEEMEEKASAIDEWCEALRDKANDIRNGDTECVVCQESEDAGPHHEFEVTQDAVGNEQDDECGVEGCNKTEEEHHDYEEDLDSAKDEAQEAVSDFSY